MKTNSVLSSKVTDEHLAKLAYVYVRQSSLTQVIHHAESTDLQYGLVDRAHQLGWPKERIQVIDDDLGKSAASAEDRSGFQTLMAEIGLGRVGIILSMDASRLSRKNIDWYRLLELCSLFGTLIADGESLHDPRIYADRLLLGLTGMMSEAELHQIKMRMHAGALNKAERGELSQPLPVGLLRTRTQEVILNPDEEVQSRILLVLQKFKELRSANAVQRYLQKENLNLPSRPLQGPAPHAIVWQKARYSTVLAILKNPAYAGVYAYGRSTRDPVRHKPGHSESGIVHRPIADWPIILQGVYPAFLTWEEYLANQQQLQDNQNRYHAGKPGAPRKGQALLQGILLCGQCGTRMHLRYSGPHGQFPVYRCRYDREHQQQRYCQEVRAFGLDEEIERILLAALAPDQIKMALASLEQIEQEQSSLSRQWQLRLERTQFETERARRQYSLVEPENRLVARSLERSWEQKMRETEKVEHEYQDWLVQHRLEITPADRQEILSLGENLPKLWNAASTTPADRKQIVRLLIRDVVVDPDRVKGKVWFQINWQTGAVSEHCYTRRVQNYANYPDFERLEQRIRQLHAQNQIDRQIAATLNTEGFRNAHLRPFSGKMIWILRTRLGLPTVIHQGYNPNRWEDGTCSIAGAAEILGVFPGTIYSWIRNTRLAAFQVAPGTPWKIILDDEKIISLKKYLDRVRRSKRKAS
jgi:DNA invertase Pin-like site-specific DNA recombinase